MKSLDNVLSLFGMYVAHKVVTVFAIFMFIFASSVASQNFSKSDSVVIQRVDSLVNLPYEYITSNNDEAMALYNVALKDAQKIGYKKGEGFVYSRLGILAYLKGLYDEELNYTIKAMRLLEEVGELAYAGYQMAELGYRMKRRDLEKAQQYMLQGIAIIRSTDNQSELSSAYNNYGVIKEMKQELDSALFYYEMGLEIKQSLGDSLGIPYSLLNIANINALKGNYERALDLYNEGLAIRLERKDMFGVSESYIILGEYYMLRENWEQALFYLRQAIKVGSEIKYHYLVQSCYEDMAKIFESTARFDSALVYQRKATNFRDSLTTVNLNEKIAQLQVQFESEQRERELIQQEAELQRRTLIIWILAILIISVFAIAFIIYRAQKFKQIKAEQENKLKLELAKSEVQNQILRERERISRDLHDHVGSQMTNIITGLEIGSLHLKNASLDKVEEMLHSLDGDARGAMGKLRESIWMLNKDSVGSRELESHLRTYCKQNSHVLGGLRCQIINHLETDIQLNPTQSLHVMRIAQEALNNTRKYGEANKFTVEFFQNENNFRVEISDDGKGMDVGESEHLGNGISNIRSRVEELGGTVSIASAPEKGVEISFQFEIQTIGS